MKFILATIFLISLYQLPEKICKFYNFKINIVQRYFGIGLILSSIYLINVYFLIFFSNSKFLNILIFLTILVLGFRIYDVKIKLIQIIDFFKKKEKIEILVALVLILYFLSSFFPLSDLDSLRYHMWIPKQIISESLDSYVTWEFAFFGANEIINLFSLNLNFENFSSNLNFLFLLGIYESFRYCKEKGITHNNICMPIFISSLYFISIVTSQKLFILPVFITSFSFIYFFLNYKKISKNEILVLDLLLFFAVSIKLTFAPYLLLFFLIKNFYVKNIFLENCLNYFILSLLFLFPLLWFKFTFFKEPLVPLYAFNKSNLEWLTLFKNYIFNYKNLNNPFLNLLKIFIPLSISEISQTLFPSMITLFFINIKKNTKLILVLLVFFLIPILFFKNFQSRWFLPTLPLIAILYNVQNPFHNIIKKFFILILILKIFFITPLALVSIASTFSEKVKNTVLRHSALGFQLIEFLNEKYPYKKIITDVQSFYYINHVIPIFSLNFHKELIDQISFKKDFFNKNLKNEEKFIIVLINTNHKQIKYTVNDIKKKLNLQNINILKQYNKNFQISGRNFLISNQQSIEIFECQMKR